MSDEKIVQNMINFITVREKDFIYETNKNKKKKNIVVDSIVKHLEQELENEDK